MELASAPLSKWQLMFSAHISCVYEGKISVLPRLFFQTLLRGGEVSQPCCQRVTPWVLRVPACTWPGTCGYWFGQHTALPRQMHTVTMGHRDRPVLP